MEKLINDFSVGLFFWQSLLFIALILLLKKFAWGPILSAVEEREEGIKEALESAEKAKKAEISKLRIMSEEIFAEIQFQLLEMKNYDSSSCNFRSENNSSSDSNK